LAPVTTPPTSVLPMLMDGVALGPAA